MCFDKCSESYAREPVLPNTWKHHAGFLRTAISRAVADGAEGLAPLACGMLVIGADLMDFCC